MHYSPIILTGTTLVAIQFAAISGLSPIITTVSPSNNAFVKSLGATHPLDRSLDAAALTASVRDITAGKNLRYVIDAISTVQTQATGYRVLADIEGGLLITDLPAAVSEEEKAKGKKVEIVNPFTFQHPQFVQDLFSHFDKLLETGEFKVGSPRCVHDTEADMCSDCSQTGSSTFLEALQAFHTRWNA